MSSYIIFPQNKHKMKNKYLFRGNGFKDTCHRDFQTNTFQSGKYYENVNTLICHDEEKQ